MAEASRTELYRRIGKLVDDVLELQVRLYGEGQMTVWLLSRASSDWLLYGMFANDELWEAADHDRISDEMRESALYSLIREEESGRAFGSIRRERAQHRTSGGPRPGQAARAQPCRTGPRSLACRSAPRLGRRNCRRIPSRCACPQVRLGLTRFG